MTEEERAALLREIAETKASAAQVRKILDTIPTLASCNLPDGSNEFLNQRWHDYTGLSPQEARGRGWRVAIHPEDLQKVLDTFRALRASGEPGEIEHRLRRHDGEYRWFLFRVEPLRDELGNIVRWYGTNTDIENLKRTEEKLRQDERELRRITDAIPHTIVIQRPDGTPIYANQAVLDYSGFTMEDVVASDFRARLFHPEDLERLREERQAALSRGLPFEIEQRARRKDGQYRWFLIRYNPFRDEQGRLVRWYATGTDIDDRKRTEDRVRNENIALREDIVRSSMFEEIVGSSAPLRRVLAQVEKVAPTVSTVLILGETGTGKELIARAIHSRSKRSARAFIRVNCAAIPATLVASELFGHEKGAFTGALQRRLGRFEAADGGTLFLDEVGELPPEAQVALLRVLQEGEFERVGGSHTISVDVRVLAATNRDLGEAVAEGKCARRPVGKKVRVDGAVIEAGFEAVPAHEFAQAGKKVARIVDGVAGAAAGPAHVGHGLHGDGGEPQHLELLRETGWQAELGGIEPVAFGAREVGIAVEPVTDADHGGRVRSDDVVHLRGVDLAIE